MEVVHGLHQALHPLVQLRQIKHGVVKLVVEFGEDRGHKIDTGTDRPLGGSSTRPSASPLPRSRPPFGVHVPDGTPPRVSGAVMDILSTDRPEGSQNALGMTGGRATLHDPLAFTRRLVHVLGAVVQVTALPVFLARQHLALRRPIPRALVGDHHRGTYVQPVRNLRKNVLAAALLCQLWMRISKTLPSWSTARHS